MKNKGLSIGDVADRTGLSVSAIRHYEAAGLVTPWRNSGGQRRFARADIRRLSFVMISQELGFSLRAIKRHLDGLPAGRTPTQADWTRISVSFRRDIDDRINRLTQMRDRLDGCIGCGCLSLKTCAIWNAGDRANRKGSGPRYLKGDLPEVD